jgi:hypothetical protein
MVLSALVDTARRARASWRGQLMVLAAGAVLLGLTLLGGGDAADLQQRMLVGSVEVLLLIAASTRMALHDEAGYDGDATSVGYEVLLVLPRLLTQVGTVLGIPIVVTWLAMQVASATPALGDISVPVAFAVYVFTLGPALLAISAVVQHDRDWLPRSTFRALRGRQLAIAGIVLAGGVAACCVALPLVLLGFVVNAVGGMLGFLGAGLAAAGTLPLLGCGALATWRALGAVVTTRTLDEDEDAATSPAIGSGVDLATAFGASTAPAAPAALAAPAAPEPVTTWMDGPSWDVAIEPGAVWGTWIRIDAPSVLGFRLTWHGGPAPELAFASEAGTWTRTEPLRASGDVLQAALPAGSTYVQVTSRAPTAQAVTVGMLVPPAAAA